MAVTYEDYIAVYPKIQEWGVTFSQIYNRLELVPDPPTPPGENEVTIGDFNKVFQRVNSHWDTDEAVRSYEYEVSPGKFLKGIHALCTELSLTHEQVVFIVDITKQLLAVHREKEAE